MGLIIGWLLALSLAAILVAGIYVVGCIGLRRDQHKDNPLEKESNFWW